MPTELQSRATGGSDTASIPQGGPVQDDGVNFFPHLPKYSDPTTGLLSMIPSSWIPYAQLMRLDRPAGFYAFYIPYLIGITYVSCITMVPPKMSATLLLAAGLTPFNVLLRGAACTWNDIVDQRFDRRVAGCRHRPVARGAVSTGQALVFMFAQVALWGYYLSSSGLFPPQCVPYAATSLVLFVVYALMKRVTYYPQLVLGVAFAWALFFSVAALGAADTPGGIMMLGSTLTLFGANVLWTVTYDTIYAHQDIADDEQAGVKGMALRFRNSTKALAGVLTIAKLVLLTFCGIRAESSVIYFLGTVGGVAAAMAYYIWDVDLASPERCGQWFHKQLFLVGTAFMSGMAGEHVKRLAV
ncbi:putative 4-hydroxybenzoate polyprenyl transferase [Diaporthe sp. PMI_573]|nr:putative 4-hydroxybenzoate polyprenyl transferase [Diaporthaceae sp. PMI_573]